MTVQDEPRGIHDPSGGVHEIEPKRVDGAKHAMTDDAEKQMDPPPAPKPTRIELPLPPDVEPPTKGWPKFWLNRNIRIQKEDPKRPGYLLVPPPNTEEQAFRKERDYVATIERSIVQECDVANQVGSGMVVFISTKGDGSKTTQAIWSATGLCRETGTEVTVFDANFVAGTAAQRLGFGRGETLTERELIDNFDRLSASHRALNEYLKNNRDRVRVLAAAATIGGKHKKLTGPEYGRVAELLRNNCDFLYVDMAQDATSEQCLALIEMATVPVFVANVGEQDSLRKLWEAMETLRSFGFADKINRSVVSITNMPPGAEAADYRKYLNEVNVHNQVVREIPGHVGPLVGIHHDPAMAEAKPVVFGDLRRETAQDIRLVNTAILSQIQRKQDLLSLTTARTAWLEQHGSSTTDTPHLVPVNQY